VFQDNNENGHETESERINRRRPKPIRVESSNSYSDATDNEVANQEGNISSISDPTTNMR